MGIIHDIVLGYTSSQEEDDDPILRDVGRRMDAWLEVHVDPKQVAWGNRKAADEWQELCDERGRREDEMLIEALREVGENQIAIALVEDEEYYMGLIEEANAELRSDDLQAGEVRGRGGVLRALQAVIRSRARAPRRLRGVPRKRSAVRALASDSDFAGDDGRR